MVCAMNLSIKNYYHIYIVAISALILSFFRIKHSLKQVPVFGNYDSASYFEFSLFGGLRMPLITFIYSTIENQNSIVLLQSILSLISFTVLGLVFFKLKKNKNITIIFSVAVLLLGNTNQVVYLDSTIDSESLNITFLILLLSSLINLFNSKRQFNAFILFLMALILYSGIKTMNNIVSIFVIFLLLIFCKNLLILKGKEVISYALISFLIISNIYYFMKVNITPELNTSGIINSRIWEVPNWKKSVLESNFPVEARSIYLRFKNENLGLPPDTAVGNLPQFQIWYSKVGKNFLIEFMIKHPGYTFFGPIALPVFSNNFSLHETVWRGVASGVLDNNTYLSPNSNFSSFDFIFWPLERTNAYIYVSLILFVLSISFFILINSQNQLKNLNLLKIFTLLSLFISYFAWWFGSTPPDLARHQFPFAISMRILFLYSLLLIVDLILKKGNIKLFLKRKLVLS